MFYFNTYLKKKTFQMFQNRNMLIKDRCKSYQQKQGLFLQLIFKSTHTVPSSRGFLWKPSLKTLISS